VASARNACSRHSPVVPNADVENAVVCWTILMADVENAE